MGTDADKQFAVTWSEELCSWIVHKVGGDEVTPPAAVYGTLAAAVVLARAIGMRNGDIKEQFQQVLEQDFPEELALSDLEESVH